MLAVASPAFAANVFSFSAATEGDAGAAPAGLLGRVAVLMHHLFVEGLRDTAKRLHRSHALLDFTVACVVAAASGATQGGVRVGGSCVLLALVMAAASTGLTLYYVAVRPFVARFEVCVAAVQSGTLAVLCCLTLAVVASGGSAVRAETLQLAGLAAEVVTFGAPIVLLVPVVWTRLRGGGSSGSSDQTPGPAAASPSSGDTHAPLLTLPSQTVASPARAATEAIDVDVDAARPYRRNPLGRRRSQESSGRDATSTRPDSTNRIE
jgi:hypothetical protein